MNLELSANKIEGEVEIISSKSELHRMIILACLKNSQTRIFYCGKECEDVIATLSCMREIGVIIEEKDNGYTITPPTKFKTNVEINVKESGSTLRFLLPVLSILGISCTIKTEGRLSERPLFPLDKLLQENGVTLSRNGDTITLLGKLSGHDFKIDGAVSSQFVTGLLLSLVAKGEKGSVTVTGKFESKPYVDLTVDVMRKMGVSVEENDNVYTVIGKEDLNESLQIKAGGDWSNSAFFACMGAVGGSVIVKGALSDSKQGDSKVLDILQSMGAKINVCNDFFSVEKSELKAVGIDASDIPDIIPPLACVCARANGVSKIYNATRLRLKESDRIKTVVNMLKAVGVVVEETQDGMMIYGNPNAKLCGEVDGANDHRIVMSSAILAIGGLVTINGAQAVKKSYPQFFEEIKKLGYEIKEV